MRLVVRFLFGVLALPLCGEARADVVSAKPDKVAITAYRDPGAGNEYYSEDEDDYQTDRDDGLDESDGLVLVTEWRTIDIPAGPARISFRGVAEGIIPQTVTVEGLPSGVAELNHDYDLLSPGALIGKSIGKRVRLVRTNPYSGVVSEETAVVRSGPQGVVLDYGDGRIEAVACSGFPERLVFEEIPEGLADQPTLSVRTLAPAAGRYQVRISYLALGVRWAADYVARIHADGKRLDLTGWITLSNHSSTSFVAAPTQVVAGELAREAGTEPPPMTITPRSASCWQMDTTTRGRPAGLIVPPPPGYEPYDGVVESLVVTAQKREENMQDVPIAMMAFESDLADYKLYDLPEPTTVAAHQTKQVMMLQQNDVPFERIYVVDLDDLAFDPDEFSPAMSTVRMQNRKDRGLGRSLPAGKVAVLAPHRGGELLVGEDRIADSPVGLPVDLELGKAIDVRAAGDDFDEDRALRRRSFQIEVVNDRPEPVTVELTWRAARGQKIVRSSLRPVRRYGRYVVTVKLGAGKSKMFRFTTFNSDGG